ncbi:hypothetical protein G4B88_023684 [Cannabis sativa]|uniref:Protein kinase domain-containing protein n=1 Tax=Cannabis sativa TaxID=3483 RepID=A0A7J6HXH2_CANSA|nr:hypothetical protein G4B88_023684 [Cannabis sativa]
MGDAMDCIDSKKKMVFVTVGTTCFDALVKTMDTEVVKEELFRRGYTHLLIQMGRGSYVPTKSGGNGSLAVDYFTFSSSIADHLRSASLVISHAGSGSIFETLRLGKPLIVVVNEDLMDNHQTELAEELANRKHLYYAHPQTLNQIIKDMNLDSLVPYHSGDATPVAKLVNRFLGFPDDFNTTGEAAEPPGLANNTLKQHSSHFHNNQGHHHHHHHHGTFPSKSLVIIIISVFSVLVLLAIFLIILMLKRLKSAPKKNSALYNESNSINNGSGSFITQTSINFNSSPELRGGCLYGGHLGKTQPQRYKAVQIFTYKELEVATTGFSEANVIGRGGFGVVYRGVLSDGTEAAIKMLHRAGKQGERAFRVEVDLLSMLHSPYLVELLGYCADQHHRLLIFEYMPSGTLHHYLHEEHQPLDWGTRLRIALDCAMALETLHEHAIPPIIHRDFKCSNVLLDTNFRAKVSDFGLAKMGSDKINGQISTRVLGTTGYLAPEYASTGKLTTKSDVYSYGVVLLELLTGRVPVDTKRPPGEHVLVSWALPGLTNREKLVEMVDPALKGHYSKKDLIQIAAIAAMCVQPEADYRPLMTDVVQSLIPLVKNSSGFTRFQSQRPSPSPKYLRTQIKTTG